MRNYLNLTRVILINTIKSKKIIVLISLFFSINLILDLVVVLLGKDLTIQNTLIFVINNMFILINSLFLGVFFIVFTMKLFQESILDNLVNIEKRYGYKVQCIFFSRIIVFVIFYLSILLINLVLNSIFYSFAIKDTNTIHYFLLSSGWYAIVALFLFLVTTFFSLISKEVIASIISSFLLIFILAIPSFSGLLFTKKIENLNNNYQYEKATEWGSTYYEKNVAWDFLNIYNNQFIYESISNSQQLKIVFDELGKLYDNIWDEEQDRCILNSSVSGPGKSPYCESYFFLGPALWTGENNESDGFDFLENQEEYKNLYEFISYFHNEIFAKKTPSTLVIDDFSEKQAFPNLPVDDLNNTLKSNIKYSELNYILEEYYHLYREKIVSWLDLWRNFGGGTMAEAVKYLPLEYYGKDRLDEYFFFRTINVMCINFYKNAESNISNYDLELTNQLIELNKNNILFNPILHFQTMFFGSMYKDNLTYYAFNITNDFLFHQNVNLQINKNETNFEFSVIVNAVVLYIIYTIIFLFLIFSQYFIFVRKIYIN